MVATAKAVAHPARTAPPRERQAGLAPSPSGPLPSSPLAPRLAPSPRSPPCACGGNCPRCQRNATAKSTTAQPQHAVTHRHSRPSTVQVPILDDSAMELEAAAVAHHVLALALPPDDVSPRPTGLRRPSRPSVVTTPLPVPGLGAGEAIDASLRNWFEARFGVGFAAVRIHRGQVADRWADSFHARAFTFGSHIVLGHDASDIGTPAGRSVLAHELAHTVQQATPRPGAYDVSSLPRGPPSPGAHRLLHRSAGVMGVQCLAFPDVSLPTFDDVTGAVVSVGEGAWDTAVDVGGAAAEFAGDQLANLVEYFAPGLLSFVRGGFAGQLTDLFCSGLDALVGALLSPLQDLDIVSTIQQTFSSLSEGVQSMWSGLGEGATAAAGALMQPLVEAIEVFGDPILDGITGAADTADGIFSSLWENVGVPVLDFLESVGGAIWTGFTGMISWIEEITGPLRAHAEQAWDWLCEQFNLAWEGTSGIRDWLAEQASALWDSFLETIEPIRTPLMAVAGTLLLLSPLGPIVVLTQVLPPIYQKLVWLWNNWNTEDILVQAREILANDILPGIIGLVSGVSAAIAGAASWLAGVTADVASTFGDVLGAFGANRCLSAVTRVLDHVASQFQELADWADQGFTGLGDAIRSVFDALAAIFQPILDFLLRLILVALNPPLLPIAIAAAIWMLCPDDLKPPVIAFVLEFITQFVRGFPAFLSGLGPMASLIKAAVLGFLDRLKGQDDNTKVAASNKVANIAAGGGPQFVGGYAVGLLEGLIDGILDPIKLIIMLVRVVASVCQAIGDRLAPLVLGGVPGVGTAVGAVRDAMAVPPSTTTTAGTSETATSTSTATATATATGAIEATPDVTPSATPSADVALPSGPTTHAEIPTGPPPNPSADQAPPPVEERFGGEPGGTVSLERIGPERGAGGDMSHAHDPPGAEGSAAAQLQSAPAPTSDTESVVEVIPVPDPMAQGAVPDGEPGGANGTETEPAPAAQGAFAGAQGEAEFEVMPGEEIPDQTLAAAISPATIGAVTSGGAELTGADAELESGGESEAREAGSSVSGLANLLSGVWDQLIAGAQNLGSRAADAVLRFLQLSDYELGNKVGYVCGLVLFEVLLAIVTAGAWLEASAVGKFLKPIVRLMDAGGEILGAVARGFRSVRGPFMRGMGAVRGFLGRFRIVRSILDKLDNVAHAIFRFGDEAAGATRHADDVTRHADDVGRHADDVGRHADDAGRHSDDAASASRKASELPRALVEARGICELNDAREPSPSPLAVRVQLLAALKPRYPWIKDFYSVPKGAGIYEIHMRASDHTIDPRYTTLRSDVIEDRASATDPRTHGVAEPDIPEAPGRIRAEDARIRVVHDHGVAHGKMAAVDSGLSPDIPGRGRSWENPYEFDGPFGHGIDDIMFDARGNPVILEFKGGTSTLGPTQLSEGWVRRKIAELRRVNDPMADILERAMNNGTLTSRVYRTHVDDVGEVLGTVLEETRRYRGSAPGVRRSAMGSSPPREPRVLNVALTEPGEVVDTPLRHRLERHLGSDLSDVRIHQGPTAAAAASSLNARAFAVDRQVFLGSASGPLRSPLWEETVAHECVHAVQASRPPAAEPADPNAAESEAVRSADAFVRSRTPSGDHRKPVVPVSPSRIHRADPAAVAGVMAHGTTPGTGLQFWPTQVVDTQVGPISGQGGLLLPGLNRLHVILAAGVTLRGLARALLPLWTTATPFTPPGGGAPVPLPSINAEDLARALLLFNAFYLPATTMERWRSGVTFPLPVEIDARTGIATLHPGLVLAQAAALDPALLPQLDTPTAALAVVPAADVAAQVAAFLVAHPDALSRGVQLGSRALVNARAERPFFEEIFRTLTPANGFEVALSFMDHLVNLQVERLASQQDGAAILAAIRAALAQAPAAPTPDVQSRLDRAILMLGLPAVAARPPPAPRAVGAVTFIELPTERFFGFDPTTNPRWLTLPTGEDRHVGFTAAPATAAPAFVSLNPAIATVTSTADQLEVHGVADGATEIEAREGAARVGRLRVEVKDERRRSTAFHFVRDSAVPPHRATAAPTAATMLDLLNRVWQRQANVLYTLAATRNIVMPGDLGVAVDDDGFGGGEMGLVTAQGAAAQYRVFRVWDVRLAGAAVNGGLNNGANTLVANAPCGDGWGLPHEAGHALGLGHGDGGVMRPCGIRVNQRVLHAAADRVNP